MMGTIRSRSCRGKKIRVRGGAAGQWGQVSCQIGGDRKE